MASFLERLRGTDEEEVRRRAQAAVDKYEKRTGEKVQHEKGLEEGDLTDYIAPIKGIGKGIIQAIMSKSAAAGTKAAGKVAGKKAVAETGEKIKKEIEGPDYKNENIAFRPTKPGAQVGWERFNFKKPQ